MLLITTACAITFFLLAMRSLLLAIAERKPGALRLLDLLFAAVFFVCGLAIKTFTPLVYNAYSLIILLLLGLLILLPLIRRLKLHYQRRPALTLLKVLLVLLLLTIATALIMMQGFLRVFEDQPVLKVTMTGITRTQDVQWKPPDLPTQHQKLTLYEVLLRKPDGQPLAQVFLYGDQVAIKAKVIRFKPSLNLIGLRTLCKIEYVYNGYTTANRHNFYPHKAVEIELASPTLVPWRDRFWRYWERLYYQKSDANPLIKSATLESTFFPLVDSNGHPFRGSYFLTVNIGGLSGVRTND